VIRTAAAAILCLFSVAGAVSAQSTDETAPKSTPLRLQVVLSRYKGDTKVSSMPNTLWVNVKGPEDRNESSLHIGVSVPVHVIANNTPTVAFKDVGNRITCSAVPLADGRYSLSFSVEQSSVDNPPGASSQAGQSGMPLLKSFWSNFTMVLRDGQTVQAVSATDPVTGEVLKVDVTLNVVK
jgi:hypothetical protein